MLGVERRRVRLRILERHHGFEVVEQHLVGRLLIGRGFGCIAALFLQRHQIGRHVGGLLIGEPEVRHVGVGAEMLRVAHPVEHPLVSGLVADVLERLPERAANGNLGALAFGHDMAALAADRLDDLLAALRVAVRRTLHGELVRLRVGEQIRDDRVDLDLVSDGILGRAVVRVVEESRHPRRRLHGARIPDPRLHPVGRQLRFDLGEDGPGLPDVLEAFRLMARVAAGALVRGVRQVQRVGLRREHLLLVALRARRFRHLRRQHRVVPQVRLLPVILLLPFLLLLFTRRRV